MVKQYIQNPIVIKAIEWTGNNLKEVINFIGLHPSAEKWTWKEYEQVVKEKGLKIFNLEGTHMVTIGDFIIKSIYGEPYVCKPDIFFKTYKEVNKEQPLKFSVSYVENDESIYIIEE